MLGVQNDRKVEDLFIKMDLNNDGQVTEDEFLTALSEEKDLMTLLTPNMNISATL